MLFDEKLCEFCNFKLKISTNKFFKCLTQNFVKAKKVIEHKAGYYYQNRFNNNGYFISNGLFVTYSMSLSMLMIEQIVCLTFWPGHYCYNCSIFVMRILDTRGVHSVGRCAHSVLNDYALKYLDQIENLSWSIILTRPHIELNRYSRYFQIFKNILFILADIKASYKIEQSIPRRARRASRKTSWRFQFLWVRSFWFSFDMVQVYQTRNLFQFLICNEGLFKNPGIWHVDQHCWRNLLTQHAISLTVIQSKSNGCLFW